MILSLLILLLILILIVGLKILKKYGQGFFNPGFLWKILFLEFLLIIFAPLVLLLVPNTQNVYQMLGTTQTGIEIHSIYFYCQLILFLLGILLGAKAFKIDKYKPQIILSYNNSAILSLLIVYGIIMLLVLTHVSKIPLLTMFTSGTQSAIDRATVGNELAGIYSILHTLSITLSWLLIYISAAQRIQKRKYFLLLILGSFGLAWFGHKSSLILAFLGFYFYSIQFERPNLKKNISFVLFSIVLLIVLMIIYYSTIANKSQFVEEFLNRLFVGQMHGYYQEFEFFESSNEYWKSWIPMSSFIFGQQISYASDLMVYTEGISATNQMKNTFLGAEAHRVLGDYLAILIMPIIGFILIKSIFIVNNFVTKLLGEGLRIPLLWTFTTSLTITNGIYIFSSFRYIYIYLIALLPVILLQKILSLAIKDKCKS